MSDQSHNSSGSTHIDGVFVMGMFGSGLDPVERLYCQLGLRSINASDSGSLAELNDRLLQILGGSRQKLPATAPQEVARTLRPFRDEARDLFENTLAASEGIVRPWVWADSRLCMLASFWKEALAISPALLLIHRNPAALEFEGAELALFGGADGVFRQWDRYNRAAMVQCFEWPTCVLRFESLVGQAKAQVDLAVDFLARSGIEPVDGGVEQAIETLESVAASLPDSPLVPFSQPSGGYRVLERILEQMDGIHVDPDQWQTKSDLLDDVATFYDEEYYGESYDTSGVPYTRDEKQWVDFFASIARSIVATISPKTALDVGCATGILVEEMRNLGVDARGMDVSAWAIAQVPDELKAHFTVGTITDELVGHYDLITCFEVVEHLPAFVADKAIANLCRHTDAILFSSTPDDFDETTHLNVEPAAYWAQLFFRHGFVRDVDYDASFLTPHAVLFRRRTLDIEELVGEYERAVANVTTILGTRARDAVAEHDRLAARFNALASDHNVLASEQNQKQGELDSLRASLTDLQRRRTAEVLAAHDAMQAYERGQQRLSHLVEVRDAELAAIRQTKTFRYTTSLRRLYGRLRRPSAGGEAAPNAAPAEQEASYDLWVEHFDTLDEAARAAIQSRLDRLNDQPLVSVILPVYNTPSNYLKAAIDSVTAQLYTNWELCIADDCSTEPHVAEILTAYAGVDQRIQVVRRSENGHISAASNSTLDVATGKWIAHLDHDDVLPAHALALAVLALDEHDNPGLLYSDEDKIDDAGRRHSPNFKPDFDPLLLLGQNYLTHLALLRRDLVVGAGGYREGFEGSQDWDLLLRVTERLAPAQIVHVPHILYHWRSHPTSTAAVVSAKPYAASAGRQCVVEHLERRGLQADVSQIALSGHNRVTWSLPAPAPLVSIVIPTKDGPLLQRCIDSVLSFTAYPNFEIVVVDNASQQLSTLQYLREREGLLTVIRDDRPFNYSALNNAAVQRASGSVICLLNDDTEVISEDWLDEMVGQLFQPDVGAVGAKLYYSDGRIQHAGIILGIGGVAGHSHRFSDRLSSGYFGRLLVAQNLSAVTGACMVVRREAWFEVGGLNEEHLAIAFNDVDFGIRLREAGWRIVWTPYAEMYHHESISRGPDTVGDRIHEFPKEVRYIQGRWPGVLRSDPAYNPNLSLVREDFGLAWPPRVSYR